MTRKHFEAIAATIAANPGRHVPEVKKVAYDLADQFAYFNPNFDRSRFLAACDIL